VQLWQWLAVGFFAWVVLVITVVALFYAGHGPGRGKARNQAPPPDRRV
jgi:hypothetical protein